MSNYPGRVSRAFTVPERVIDGQFIRCAACGKEDNEDGSGVGFWRMIPPVAGWDSSEENWACQDCLNKVNAIFGVAAKEM